MVDEMGIKMIMTLIALISNTVKFSSKKNFAFDMKIQTIFDNRSFKKVFLNIGLELDRGLKRYIIKIFIFCVFKNIPSMYFVSTV